jgi:hypothetical protein
MLSVVAWVSTLDTRKEGSIYSAWWLWVNLLLTAFLVIWFMTKPVEEILAGNVEAALSTILAAVATVVFTRVTREFGYLKTRPGFIMMFIAAGFCFWSVAEAIWFYYILAGFDPFPSIADVFWIGGYVPLIVALVLNARMIPVKFSKSGLAAWAVLSLLVALIVLGLIVVPLLVEDASFEAIITVVYPIEDVILIVPAFVVVLKFRSGQVAVPWAFLTTGFLLTAVGDILYTYAENQGLYGTAYNPTDLFLLLGYVASIFAGFLFVRLYRAQSVKG